VTVAVDPNVQNRSFERFRAGIQMLVIEDDGKCLLSGGVDR
jgi:hypothetical protein